MSETIKVTNSEYSELELLCQHKIDYVITYSEKHNCYFLVVHGDGNGHVIINNIGYTLEGLAKLLSLEQNTKETIKVFCCYGASLKPYSTDYIEMSSYFNNKQEVWLSLPNTSQNYFTVNYAV